ncbi:MAG: hypothetical protein AMJ81_05125 [Phycisphaerae bacterium SM23_33]|jgi:hypothetical protein|nr:MAG: hypothetical protein AMJ81_05125 [Phycisphaerae bacterium SM23_33]
MRRAIFVLSATLCSAGCSSRLVTNTPRSAIEQLLLSRAVDKALDRFELPELADRKVFVDFANLKAYDQEYIKVATRARFAELGATLVEQADQADLVAEVASGALGIEYKNGVVGLPAIPVPNSPVPFPEAPLYRTTEQTGIIKLLIFVHDKGRFVAANHYYAKADRDESFILWWRFQRQDEVRQGWERADLKLQAKPAAAGK